MQSIKPKELPAHLRSVKSYRINFSKETKQAYKDLKEKSGETVFYWYERAFNTYRGPSELLINIPRFIVETQGVTLFLPLPIFEKFESIAKEYNVDIEMVLRDALKSYVRNRGYRI